MGDKDTTTFAGATSSFVSADHAHVSVARCFTILVKRRKPSLGQKGLHWAGAADSPTILFLSRQGDALIES